MQNREAVVSGQFYSSNIRKLNADIARCFSAADNISEFNDIAAIISPHAGYVYSGEVAANAFSKIDPNKEFHNIFILAPSHHASFNGASIYNLGNYETPLGEVEVNIKLATQFIEQKTIFSYYDQAHLLEHSLEVQLPFIQYWFNKKVKIVPIVIGTSNLEQLGTIAKLLKPYFNQDNLFVISSDFSHFPTYDDANKADLNTANAIVENDILLFDKVMKQNSKISGVATSACGNSAIKVLLNLTAHNSNFKYEKLRYMNSGDVPFGDKSRVVGYWAMAVTRKPSV